MSPRRPSRWHGLLPVYKSPGPTSHDIVDLARRALGERRIGHTGTLDPMAEGLLLLCVGQATRLQQFLVRWEKTYRGQIRLGRSTTTYDGEGDTSEPSGVVPELERAALDRIASRFTGEIAQEPPPYSAKKVAGKRMYELARAGQPVAVEPKTVVVHALALAARDEETLEVEVTSSSGFYVRSLAHDVGRALGCGGYLDHLERVSIGPYSIDAAVPQDLLESTSDPEQIVGHPAWIPIDRVELPFPHVELNRGAAERFIHGQEVVVLRAPGGDSVAVESEVAVRSPDDRLLGVGIVQSVLARGRTVGLRPSMVLQPTPPAGSPSPSSRPTVAREETS